MAKITPIINGQVAPVHGSFIIGPGCDGGLDLDGRRIKFMFQNDPSGNVSADVDWSGPELILTMFNLTELGGALDLNGYHIGGVPVRVHLAFSVIGNETPHRIVTYTVSALPPEN